MTNGPTIIEEETQDHEEFDSTTWDPKRYYHGRTRIVAVITTAGFLLPLLYIFGIAIKELIQPPPSPYAAPPEAPEVPPTESTE